jgi:hypothetical protein
VGPWGDPGSPPGQVTRGVRRGPALGRIWAVPSRQVTRGAQRGPRCAPRVAHHLGASSFLWKGPPFPSKVLCLMWGLGGGSGHSTTPSHPWGATRSTLYPTGGTSLGPQLLPMERAPLRVQKALFDVGTCTLPETQAKAILSCGSCVRVTTTTTTTIRAESPCGWFP